MLTPYFSTAAVVAAATAAVALPLWRSGDVGIQRDKNLWQHTAAAAAASRFIECFLKNQTQIKIMKEIR